MVTHLQRLWLAVAASVLLAAGAGCIEIPAWDPFAGLGDDTSSGVDTTDDDADANPADAATDADVSTDTDGPVDVAADADADVGPISVILGSRSTGDGPLSVQFDANRAVLVSNILRDLPVDMWQFSYRWDFGDGTTARGMLANHIFAPPAADGPDEQAYEVQLIVTDAAGASETFVDTIAVSRIPTGQTACVQITGPEGDPAPPPGQEPEGCVFQAYNEGDLSAILPLQTTFRQILLRRGQNYVADAPITLRAGRRLGAWGDGARPNIALNTESPILVEGDDVAISGIRFVRWELTFPCDAEGACGLVQAAPSATLPLDHLLVWDLEVTGRDTLFLQPAAGGALTYATFNDVTLGFLGETTPLFVSGPGVSLVDLHVESSEPPGVLIDCDGPCTDLLIRGGHYRAGVDDIHDREAAVLVVEDAASNSRVLVTEALFDSYAGPDVLRFNGDTDGALVERCFFNRMSGETGGEERYVTIQGGSAVAVRNNVFNMSTLKSDAFGVAVWVAASSPSAKVWGNTCFRGGAQTNGTCVRAEAGAATLNLGFGAGFDAGGQVNLQLGEAQSVFGANGGEITPISLQLTQSEVGLYSEDQGATDAFLFVDYGGACRTGGDLRYGAWQATGGVASSPACATR